MLHLQPEAKLKVNSQRCLNAWHFKLPTVNELTFFFREFSIDEGYLWQKLFSLL